MCLYDAQQCDFRLLYLPWALQVSLSAVLALRAELTRPAGCFCTKFSLGSGVRKDEAALFSDLKFSQVSAKTPWENEVSKARSTSGLCGMGDTHQKTFPSQKLVFRLNLVVGTTTKGLNSSVHRGTAWEKLIPQEVLWEYFFHADITLFWGVH